MDSLAWPGVVFLISLVAMLLFRSSLIRLIDRTKKLTREGLETGEQNVVQQQRALESGGSGADDLLKSFDNELLVQGEVEIRKILDSRAITDPAERERVLIRFLASSASQLTFERVYRIAFGSQIAAMQYLNTHGRSPVSEIREIYSKAQSDHADFYEGFSFDEWIGFLLERELVMHDGDVMTLTLPGHEFLKYLIAQGYAFKRAL